MKRITKIACLMMAVGVTMGMVGCETVGQSAGLGAALGGATGAVIGHQSGNALEGAAIGAAVGAASGAIAKDIHNRRKRSRQETEQQYNYQPAQGQIMNLEEYSVIPSVVRPGGRIEATMEYALLGTNGAVTVTETRKLLRNDQIIAELSSKQVTRDDGTWLSAQQIKLPNDLPPGVYTLQQRAYTNQSAVSGISRFTVD